MGTIVQKFGGTSVANADLIKAAAKRAIAERRKGRDVVMSVSARGKTTDELLALADEITDSPPAREIDMLISTGEQESVALMAMAVISMGYPAISFTGAQIGMVTDGIHTKARIQAIDARRIRQALRKGAIAIVAGFQGVTKNQDITTLGRGGSDTTAVALAAVLKADVCEIYTDVDGIYTTDPRVVPSARLIEQISYDEMLELASVGAKVMHYRAVEIAKKYDVPIHVRSSFKKRNGTWITRESSEMEEIVVSGAALNMNEAKITMRRVPDKPGVAARIFNHIAKNSINIDMIIQNTSSEGHTDLSFTVAQSELKEAMRAAKGIAKRLGAGEVQADPDIAKLSVVGVGMRSHTGVAEAMFSALARAKVNIQMISTSEIKISCVLDAKHGERALRAVHAAFKLDQPKSRRKAPKGARSAKVNP